MAQKKLIEFLVRDVSEKGRHPNGGDEGLSADDKEALGVSGLAISEQGLVSFG